MPKAETATETTPETAFLLRPLQGNVPPAPNWFREILQTPRTDHQIDVDGATISWRAWGADDQAAKPVLLFVHGALAHKGWWDFIAPFFCDRWRPVAIDLSSMGDSDHRDAYSLPQFTREIVAVVGAAGGFDRSYKPALVGHSFGGLVCLYAAAREGQQFSGAAILDIPIEPKDPTERKPPSRRGGRIYETVPAALARFRLIPEQPCENLFLADYVARQALRERKSADGRGWTWAHDPELWIKFQRDDSLGPQIVFEAQCPLALFRAGQTRLVSKKRWDWMRENLKGAGPMISIPQAGHHLMLDQPFALTAALESVLETWRAGQ